jgi:hypothetical protein
VGKKENEGDGGYSHFEMDYNDLQSNINVCEYENLISPDKARKLREQYLSN